MTINNSISIDTGIKNLMTIYDPLGDQYIFRSKLKTINEFYNKKISELKSINKKNYNLIKECDRIIKENENSENKKKFKKIFLEKKMV